MINILMKKYALSKQGTIDFLKACIACVLADIGLMIPIGVLYNLVKDLIMKSSVDILGYALKTIGCLIIIFVTNYFKYNLTFFTTYKESGKRRIALAEILRKLPLSFFNKKDASDLTTIILNDSTTLEHNFSHVMPQFVGSIISTCIIAIGLFFVNWKLAIAALWVLPVTLLIVGLSNKVQNFFNRKKKQSNLICSDGVQECIETLKELKSMNAEKKYMDGLTNKIKDVEKKSLFAELGTALFVMSSTLLLKFGIASVALVGSSLLINGEINIMTFFMFLLVVSRIYEPMSGTLINLAVVISQKITIERMNELTSYEIQTGEDNITPDGYNIEFKNVEFSYKKDNKVIDDISFVANQGEVTALIGNSGSGKSTVSKLAARFWDVDKGTISLGNQDISKVDPEVLLKQFSIVFQDVMLFDNTIMENIRIGRKGATDEEVIKAAKQANCDEFVSKLPNGYNTIIGENGSRLSGGERQRISIARAILKDAPVILLDEATASLDVENETEIQESISKLIKNKTVLIIAHRMRTITNADKIVVLNDGKIVETGKPNELLNKHSIFKEMLSKQKESCEWKLN